MKISKLLSDLAYGELANLAVLNETGNSIDAKDIPKVLLGINDGLVDLHTKFNLNMKDVILQTQKHITFYYLLPQFAQSNTQTSTEPYQYIMDLEGEPFQDDVLRIMQVYDHSGCELPLNDSTKINSVFTTQTKLLQIPNAKDDEFVTVLYRAGHVPIEAGDIATGSINVPEVLQSALRCYVAYHMYGMLGTETAIFQSSTYKSKYDEKCAQVVFTDAVNNSLAPTDIKFAQRGFV